MLPPVWRSERHSGDLRDLCLTAEAVDDCAGWLHGANISDFPKFSNRYFSDNRNCRLSVFQKWCAMDIIAEILEGLKKPGKSKGGLAKALGREPSAVTALLGAGKNGKPRQVKAHELDKIRSYFQDDVENLASPRSAESEIDRGDPPPSPIPMGGMPRGATPMRALSAATPDGDMPLYRFAHAGRGNLILEEIPFESVTRPDYLAKVREPYGVMVDGESMIPEFQAGWIAEVNPNLVPRKDDACVFRGVAVDGGYWAAVKTYVREDETHWHVRQHNPRKSYKLKKSEFQSAHVVVGTDRRRR
jgi:hypothetical protein